MRDRLGDLPPPPADLGQRDLPLTVVRSPWFRCSRIGREVVFFGKTGEGRFDDPTGEFGVLYVGLDPQAAFIAVLGGQPFIPRTLIESRTLALLATGRPARVVDLTGPDPARLGIDARISAAEHQPARVWSRTLFQHSDRPDGILYRRRRDPSRMALALFERDDWTFRSDRLPGAFLADLASQYGMPVL